MPENKRNLAAICFAGYMCVMLIGIIAFCIVFPGVVEWIGIYLGLVFWVVVGMMTGAVLATSGQKSVGGKYNTAGEGGTGGASVACGCFGMLLGGAVFPLMIPLAVLSASIGHLRQMYKNGRDKQSIALMIFFMLIGVGLVATGCFFGIAEIAIRLCVVNTDDVCTSGKYNGTMNLPSGMYLNPPSIWVINQKPIYNIYPVEGLEAADWENTWSGGDWLEKSMEKGSEPLGAARFKYYPRCDSIGAPYSYSSTMELTYPDMMPNGRDFRVSQYCDKVTQYIRTGDDAWTQYIIHDCNEKVAYKLEYEMQMFAFEMKWKIKDADDNILAEAVKPFQLWEPPIVEFVSPTNGTIGKLKQNWCGNTCLKDSWNIMVERPNVVEHSVFVYLALIIRNIQLERQKDRSRRRLRTGNNDDEAADEFDFTNPPANTKLD